MNIHKSLIFITLIFSNAIFGQERFEKILLKKETTGIKSFVVNYPTPVFTNISNYRLPQGVKEYRILELHLQPGQFYRNYKKEIEKISDSSFQLRRTRFLEKDNGTYTDSIVNESIKILSFQDSLGKRFIVIDTDNNYDFTNEVIYPKALLDSENSKNVSVRKFITVKNIDFFEAKSNSIINTHADIFPDVSTFSKRGDTDTLAYVEIISKSIAHKGLLDTLYNQSEIIAFSRSVNQIFDSTQTYYIIPQEISVKNIKRDDLFHQGDVFHNNNQFFKLISIDPLGDFLTVQKLVETKVIGYRRGFISPDISSIDVVSGSPFSLLEDNSEYTLLDFWGTWCIPCVKTTSVLKEKQAELQSKKVKIVGIAWDSEIGNVRDYISKNGITWVNLFEDRTKSNLSKIVRNGFSVGEFPTFILIGKDGRILQRETGIDGLQDMLNYINQLKD